MMQRPLFICEAVETCQENSNCCPHKQPHIKDERCIPKLCRYGPKDREVDCVLADPVNPHIPKAKPVAEPVLSPVPASGTGTSPEGATVEPDKIPDEPAKEPEEKKPESSQRPVTMRKKPGRKAAK
jgi:hypothetical protein